MKAILNTAVGEHLETSPLRAVKRKGTKLKAKRTITAKEKPAFLRALKAIDPELHDLYLVQMIGGRSSLDQMAEYLGLDLELFGRRATA
jgi:hypothetical protein